MITDIEQIEYVRALECQWQSAMAAAVAVNPDAPDCKRCEDIDSELNEILTHISAKPIKSYHDHVVMAEIAAHWANYSPSTGAMQEDNDPFASAASALVLAVLATAPKTKTLSVLEQCSNAERAEYAILR